MYLITAYFDIETSRTINELIQEAEKASGNDFMTANNIPPHLTLLQFQSKAGAEKIISTFENSIFHSNSNHVSFNEIQSNIPHIVCVPVNKDAGLSEANEILSEAFSALNETIINPYYLPQKYYPHVSLSKRLDDFQLKKVKNFLRGKVVLQQGKIERIVLTEGKPPRMLCEKIFH